MKKIYPVLVLLCLSQTFSYGQGYSLLNNSNYSPINSIYFNPAKIADSKQRLQINLMSGSLYLANDYGKLKSIPKIVQVVQNNGEFDDLLEIQLNGKNKNLDFGIETRLPSFVASLGKSQSFGFSSRVRMLFNAGNVSEALMPILTKGLQNTDQFQNIPDASFDLSGNMFGEAGFTYARNLLNTGKHVLKAGATGKYLWGVGNARVSSNQTNISIIDNGTYKTVATTGVNISSKVSDGKLLDPANYTLTMRNLANGRGQGFGADLGFEYEFRPKFAKYRYEVDGKMLSDNSVPQYALKFGFSITDMGSITYAKGKTIGLNHAPYHEWSEANVLSFDPADLEQSLIDVYGPASVSSSLNYRSKLPTRLNMNLDVKVAKNFYVAANYMNGMSKKTDAIDPNGMLLGIHPRIEKPGYEIAVPITYSSRYKKTNIGLATRTGGFFIGTDDIGGAIGIGKWTSINLYAGINLSIGKKRISDRDGDHISDKLDKCPKVAGPKENDGCPWPDVDKDGIPDKDDACPALAGPEKTHGCPDTDGDGIADNGDNCPTIPGTIAAQGCPDADGDGIADKEDLCPTLPGSRDAKGCPDRDADGITDRDDLCPDLAGTAALRGCPDKDKDGITDAEDRCPELAGSLALKGCPDRDNDGIADQEDACPDAAGPLMAKGCPDTDKDGILDSQDACPTIPGPLALKGCPDKDGDGIGDSEDACPEIPGPLSSKGCPDKDGDGVPDKDDKCIDQVGPASNSGCPVTEKPVLTKVEEKIIFTAVADLQFETGKSVIKAYSYDSLDELAALMVKRPELTLILSGHTDNVGKPASNKILSVKRAQAVKNYLADAGVDPSRIAAVGYGSNKPIASNKTPQGRQKNRRVEFKVN
jgi:outer membrane protein OmpA-like peptidoglycan-associated protein